MTPPNEARTGTSTDTNVFAIQDSKDFGTRLAQKIQEWTAGNQGRAFSIHYTNVQIAYTHLYGMDVEGVGANAALITRSGDQGSIAEMRIPSAAGQLTKVWNLVVGPELAWGAVATTTDYASEAEAITAKNALQYYWVDQGVSAKAKGVAWECLGFGEGVLHIPWDESKGKEVGIEPDPSAPEGPDGQPVMRSVKQGDMDFRPVSTWNIIRDPTATSYDSSPWVVVRDFQNKYDVSAAAPNPQAKADALAATARDAVTWWRPFKANTTTQTDLIPVYYLYHRRTPSVPAGRQTVFLQNGAIISDEKLDEAYVKHLPVVRMAAGSYADTPFPYTKFAGILGAAQARDGLFRDLLTNATATSGALVSAEEDNDVPPLQLGGGPKIIYRPKGSAKPEALNLQQSHPESHALIQKIDGATQQILGLDQLTSGGATEMPSSGALAALMTSTSVQNNSQLQSAWSGFVQGIGNVVLAHIQHHMPEERQIALAGKTRADLVTTVKLSGTAVKGIDRIQVSMSSALQQTDAGKFELAQLMLKQGWAQTPQQLQTVLDTGRLDALTQDLSNELMLINSENESLGKGAQVPVMLGDNHILHLKGHRPVTASMTARQDPKVVQALQAHEAQHRQILKTTDPEILKLFGQPSLAPPPQPGPPPMSDATKLGVTQLAVKQGWAPSPQAAEQVLKTGDLSGLPPQPQVQQQAQAPSLPTNPTTGQQAGPVAGTAPPSLAIKPPSA